MAFYSLSVVLCTLKQGLTLLLKLRLLWGKKQQTFISNHLRSFMIKVGEQIKTPEQILQLKTQILQLRFLT